jgi:hypothetical protein
VTGPENVSNHQRFYSDKTGRDSPRSASDQQTAQLVHRVKIGTPIRAEQPRMKADRMIRHPVDGLGGTRTLGTASGEPFPEHKAELVAKHFLTRPKHGIVIPSKQTSD